MAGFTNDEIDRIEKWILERDYFNIQMVTGMLTTQNIGKGGYFNQVKNINQQVIKPLLEMKKLKRVKQGQYERYEL